jgi:hypothetical protein
MAVRRKPYFLETLRRVSRRVLFVLGRELLRSFGKRSTFLPWCAHYKVLALVLALISQESVKA